MEREGRGRDMAGTGAVWLVVCCQMERLPADIHNSSGASEHPIECRLSSAFVLQVKIASNILFEAMKSWCLVLTTFHGFAL